MSTPVPPPPDGQPPVPPQPPVAQPYGQPPVPTQPSSGAPYPPSYGQPYAPPPKPSTGVLPWALGFLIFVPIPFLSALIAGVAMAGVRGTTKHAGALARENGRTAANWGLTFVLVSTGLLILHFVLLFALTAGGGVQSFYPLGIPITLYFAVCVLHVVLTIIGTVRAAAGLVVRMPLAIPFIRP